MPTNVFGPNEFAMQHRSTSFSISWMWLSVTRTGCKYDSDEFASKNERWNIRFSTVLIAEKKLGGFTPFLCHSFTSSFVASTEKIVPGKRVAQNKFFITTKNVCDSLIHIFCSKNFSIKVIDGEVGELRQKSGESSEYEEARKMIALQHLFVWNVKNKN